MRIYVASGLVKRDRVKEVITRLVSLGHIIAYDWTLHGDVRGDGEARMREVAQNEAEGVASAELALLLLPGGKGTHTELGAALATRANKRIVLWSELGAEFSGGADACVFYHHPAVERLCCPFGELFDRLGL